MPTTICAFGVLIAAQFDQYLKAFVGAAACKVLLQMSFLIVILWLGERGKGLLDAKLSSHEPLSVVNGCSDELTHFSSDHLSTEFDEAQSMQHAIVVLSVIMLVALGFELCCICVLTYAKV